MPGIPLTPSGRNPLRDRFGNDRIMPNAMALPYWHITLTVHCLPEPLTALSFSG